ncbi:hypothetical protein pneo_cds_173 [Pandoravirus neocaledonia]|uniref:Uncharacterized protein n=1 Tax=Pandoravirus neocaledonia TaxID=2107708 RepID=A0A2U7UBT0_9VIRU|nr:hypothetical protein pneo_cds_173 [Pandoravirus neocaledonia]AVK75780.1 hypothetical protein pneo_cds_173 [Pandoravirus neocaledonia]
MNERITRAPSVRSDGRGRIADARRRVSTAHLDVAHQQYGAAAPATYQTQAHPSYGQYAPGNNNNNGYANDPQGGGPLYSIRSPAMPSTARRLSRAPVDPPPGDGRYYYADAAPRGARDVRAAAGVVAGISTNTRTTCAGASVRREHTVYAAPPREAGIVSHMPPVTYGTSGNGGGNGGGSGVYGSAPSYCDNGQGFYGNGDQLPQQLQQQQQQQQYAQQQSTYGGARPYTSEPPPPPPPGTVGGSWSAANCGNSNNGANYGVAAPQPSANGGPYGSYATGAPSQPAYGQQQQQQQPNAYAQPAPVQQQPQPTYGQVPSSQPSYGAPAPNGQQQQQQPVGNVGAAAPTYASAPACPPSSQPAAPGQLGVAPQGAYGVAPQPQQQTAFAGAAPVAQQQQQVAYGAAAVPQQAYAQQQAAYGAVAEPYGAVAAAQPVGAVAQPVGAVAQVAAPAVGVASPVAAAAAPVVGAVAAAAPAPVVGVAAAAAVPQAVEVAAVAPPLSVGAPTVVQQPAVFAAAPPPPVFAAAPPPVFAAQPVLAATPVCQRQLTLIRHTDRGSGNALDDEALGLGPPAGSSPFEGTIGPGPAFGDFYVLSRPNANTTLTAGQAVQLTAGPTNNTALHRGNATEIVIETCDGLPGTFEICISAVTTNPSQFGIRVAGQSTTPHVRTFGSDTTVVSGCLIIKCVRTPLIIQLVLVSTDGPGGTTTLPSSPGGTGECRIISLVIKQIC